MKTNIVKSLRLGHPSLSIFNRPILKILNISEAIKPRHYLKHLDSSEFELSHFFESTPDLVCIAQKDGYFKSFNQSVMAKLGYTKDELLARPIFDHIHPEDREATRKTRLEMLEGKALLNFVNRYVTKTGEVVWLEWTSIYFAEKELVFAIAKDVSTKRLAEIEIENKYNKFKSLATHFKSSIEKDRKFLAYELHEELAQLAAVLKMQLEMIPISVPGLPADALEKLEKASVLSGVLMKTIQRISFSISPALLDDFGLQATLEWLCKEFSVLNGIPCTLEYDCNENRISREIKFDFFRICQEALSNVMYHAQASEVFINIYDEDNKTCLYITDNGKGFDIRQDKPSAGLKSMRELAASINGEFLLQSDISEGTKVGLMVKLDEL